MKITLRIFAMSVSLVLCTSLLRAGWFDDAVNDAVQRTGKRAIDETADKGYEKAKEVGKGSVEPKEGKPNESQPQKTGRSEQRAMPRIYPGALYDAATTKFLKESMSVSATCYRTGDTADKVVTFYQRQSALSLVSTTDDGAMFQSNGGAAQGGIDVTIQRPWRNMETGKMMNDTLISIVNGQ